MHTKIIKKIDSLKEKKREIENIFKNKKIFSNYKEFVELSKKYKKIKSIVDCFDSWNEIKKEISSVKSLLCDKAFKDIAKEEIEKLNAIKKKKEKKINFLLLPNDPNDKLGCFLEIRSATGGEEAALFAKDLFKMYSRFAEDSHWDIKIISLQYGEKLGYKEIIAKISSKNSYKILKFESGGHRVQRIPETESQGRIHTSSCTVAVIPDLPKESLPKIDFSDLKIDTFRSSGAGGQHVNTTDSAIRITHIPTGIVVECQNERSQHKNKSKAIEILQNRLISMKIKQKREKESIERKILLGTGERSDRIRTYNYPKGRITDHRINKNFYQLEEIMRGKLDIILDAILQFNRINQISSL
ncbi:peptide chain release factor 1 [bacterium endosymbiont of Pedicinus badii]|uniref:peptide chain release factor 1 n=1 Tax=bacterium endosymbiont of Pedicinus badii TaxID=1719126 RepID=UPI0009BBAC21|nr:peptide chain release factor 1 [bacterium endosymbiont of Pedicinus badii]OQM34509.1 peptide chain release factor 1 [bacterium endosymbiont of Pedicinus badii]